MPIERPHDVPPGIPSPEALQRATDATRRCYVLPETMQHPEVRSQCLQLAYLIQSYGLTTANAEPRHVKPDKPPLYPVSPRRGPPSLRRDATQLRCRVVQSDEMRELAEAL
jgi:hypothetical protein